MVIVGVLWYTGHIPGETAGVVSAAVLGVFGLWIVGRWVRLHRLDRPGDERGESADARDQRDPLEKLKERYAAGEISDAEFEKQLDTLLDADRRAESSEDRSTLERNGRGRR